MFAKSLLGQIRKAYGATVELKSIIMSGNVIIKAWREANFFRVIR